MQSIDQIQWPGWNVVRLIGRGSFGAVYEIQRNLFGNVEKAALKVIHIPQSQSDIEELYNDGFDEESITARFNGYLEDIIREYSLMASLKGNKNVVYCDDVRQIQHEDGIGWDIYIKMELLTPLVKTLGKTVTEDEVINIGIDMCNALVLCKEQNIVHRDIKPQNIFVSKDGVYKLGDFGIAKTAERTTSGTKTGTYKYMAPEVYKSQPYGAAADQYSLGMVLYWLLNEHRTPFLPLPSAVKATTVTMEDAARKRRFDGEQIPPPAHGSKQLQAITLRACAYDPKNRFASAAEMLESLKALKNGSASPSVAVPMGAASFSVMSRARIMERGVRSGRDRETDCCSSHQNTTARQSARSASRKTRSAPDSAVQSLGTVSCPQTPNCLPESSGSEDRSSVRAACTDTRSSSGQVSRTEPVQLGTSTEKAGTRAAGYRARRDRPQVT